MKTFLIALAAFLFAANLYTQAHPAEGIDDYQFEVLWRTEAFTTTDLQFYDNDTKIIYTYGRSLKMLDATTGEVLPFLYEFPIDIEAFTTMGHHAFLCAKDYIQQIDLQTGEMVRQFDVIDIFINGEEKDFGASGILASPQKNRLYVLGGYQTIPEGNSKHVVMYDLNNEVPEKVALRLPIDTTIAWRYIALSPNENYIVINEDGDYNENDRFRTVVYETEGFTEHWKFNAYDPQIDNDGFVRLVEFSPANNDLIFILAMHPQVFVADIYSKQIKAKYEMPATGVRSFSPLQTIPNVIFCGAQSNNSLLADYENKQQQLVNIPLTEHGVVGAVAISANDERIIGAGFQYITMLKMSPGTGISLPDNDTLLVEIQNGVVQLRPDETRNFNSYRLINSKGKVIGQQQVTPSLPLLINLHSYPSGLYILTLTDDRNNHRSYKFIWER